MHALDPANRPEVLFPTRKLTIDKASAKSGANPLLALADLGRDQDQKLSFAILRSMVSIRVRQAGLFSSSIPPETLTDILLEAVSNQDSNILILVKAYRILGLLPGRLDLEIPCLQKKSSLFFFYIYNALQYSMLTWNSENKLVAIVMDQCVNNAQTCKLKTWRL